MKNITTKLIIVILAVLIPLSFFIGKSCAPEPETEEPKMVDVRSLKSQLVESSELTTAKLNLTCYAEYEDTGTKFFTKSDFKMIFDATVRAGINLSEVDIPQDKVDNINKIIYIKIPKATLQGEPSIDTNSIKYFDEHWALFNTNEKEDVNKAISLAKEKAKEQAKSSGLFEMADKQSDALVIGLLSKIAPSDYKIEVLKDDTNAKK